MTREEILAIQQRKLYNLLHYATTHIPYYKDLGIQINEHENILDQLKKFPLLRKKTVNADLSRFHHENLDLKKITILNSGGSSGNPGKIYVNKDDHSKMRARVMQVWENAGLNCGVNLRNEFQRSGRCLPGVQADDQK